MAHTYTFTANTLNTNLFFAKTNEGSGNTDDVWNTSKITHDNNPDYRYIADSVRQYTYNSSTGRYEPVASTRRFWICAAYFGDSDTMAHLASLASNQIESIKISFNVIAASWWWSQKFACDTASNRTGTDFSHTHTAQNVKRWLLGTTPGATHTLDDNSSGTITLDVTDFGVPSSGGWLIHFEAWTDCKLSGAVTLTIVTKESYTLSISAGTGSTIAVNRTSSPRGGATGAITNGATIYYGDVLKITFTASTNYSITTHTVNGNSFASGGVFTVPGNVTIVATATPLKSDIAATDANIGATSTITVTRYNSGYTHTITYSFGSATGTIVTNGSNTSIAWTVPSSLAAQIPNSKTGTCTLTCTTYNGNTSLGSTTCTLTLTAAAASYAPTLNCSVADVNSATITITGDSSKLIRFKSTARCTFSITTQGSATVATKKINGAVVTGNTYDIANVNASSFVFEVTDSRGYVTSQTITPTIYAYVVLTCNPVVERDAPTNGKIKMAVSGNVFRGSLGTGSNTFTLRYRYKKSTDATYGSWITIPQANGQGGSNYVFGSSSYSGSSIMIKDTNGNDDTFDYRYSYDFIIQAYDGVGGNTITTATIELTVQRGIPVFDWGENDFRVNTPFILGSTTLTETQLQRLLALLT